jgi:adenylate cyclase
LFALQNEITGRIAVALNAEMIAAEAARWTKDPDALDYIFRGRAAFNKPLSRGNYAETIAFFERALALDPQSVEAQSSLASALAGRVLDEMTDSAAGDIARAQELVEQALTTTPRSALAHFAKAQLLRVMGRCKEAIPEYETALASNRNWVNALSNIGRCRIYIGPIEDAIPIQEQAIRLSPHDPEIGLWYFRIGQAHLLQSRTDEAIVWLEKARSSAYSKSPGPYRWLASAYALKGEPEQAAAALAEAQRWAGNGPQISIAQQKAFGTKPATRALFETTYLDGLRKAGVPEE